MNWSTGNRDRFNYSFEDMPEPGPQESMGIMVGHDTADDGDGQALAGPGVPASLPATGAGALFALFGVALVASTVAVLVALQLRFDRSRRTVLAARPLEPLTAFHEYPNGRWGDGRFF